MQVSRGLAGDLAAVGQQARAAEALGFDLLTAEETAHEPFSRMTLAAEHTSRARIGSSVVIAFARSPYVMAHQAWALQKFSGGRFSLGLGTQVKGHIERRFSMEWGGQPGPRLRDYVLCMRAIWDTWQNGTKPAYEGPFYRFTLMNPTSSAGPIEHPEVNVVLAAVNPYNARLAGEVAQGIVLHSFTTPRYTHEVLLPAFEEGARRAGKSPAALEVRGGGFVVTGRDEQEVAVAREQARRRVSYYGSTRSYSAVMKLHGWDDEAALLHRLSVEGRWDEMTEVVTDEMLEQFAVVATWDEIPGALAERYGGVATSVAIGLEPRDGCEEEQVAALIEEIRGIPVYAGLGDPEWVG